MSSSRRGAAWPKRLRGLALAVLLAAAGPAHSDAAADAIATLRHGGELRCEPLWPQFCANVHVTCTGHTRIAARPFALRVRAAAAQLVVAPADADDVHGPYANARAEWDPQGASLLLSPDAGKGYIHLQADGRYAFRHYVQHQGLMSIGRCR
jgi:hypothetical protein